MNEVVRIHPELSNMVLPILIRLEERRQSASKRVQADRERDLSLSGTNIDYKGLMSFLLRYAPLQLLGEKRKTKRIPLGRRLISSCKHMYDASFLVDKAAKDNVELKAVLSVDTRSSLPHPLWTLDHDAILINAIVKHGWVDRESSCRCIVNDTSIAWGAPFQLDCQATVPKMSSDESRDLRATAQRAAEFLQNADVLLDIIKGVDRHLIIEAYGLKLSSENGDNGSGTWSVDDELLLKGSKSNEDDPKMKEAADLPTKKELAKRAKLILSKSMLVVEGGGRPLATKSSGTSNIPSTKVVDHGFTVIDQGNRCCILLAEMVRGVCKGSLTKSGKAVKYLCALVFDEAQTLKDQYASSTSELDMQRASELAKIVDQIQLARRSMKFSTTPAKNVFRAMLGLDPNQPKVSSDPVYPSQEFLDIHAASGSAAAATKATAIVVVKPRKEIVQKKDEGTSGEKAIVRSLKKSFDTMDDTPKLFSPEDDVEVGLQLTMAEVMMMHVFANEGLPLSRASAGVARNSSKDWQCLLNILKLFVNESLEESRDKQNSMMEKLELETKEKSKVDLAKKVVAAEWEIVMTTNALKQVTQMIPQGLAIKR
jgi:hypothetical protein